MTRVGVNWDPERAHRGERVASVQMWQRAADGDTGPEVLAWLRVMALKVVDQQRLPASAGRDKAIVEAVGLGGRPEPHAALQKAVELHLLMDPPYSRAELVEMARKLDARYDRMEHFDLGKLIDKLRVKLTTQK